MPEPSEAVSSEREDALDYCCQNDPAAADAIRQAARLIASRSGADRHDALVVLGSGLRDALDRIGSIDARIPLSELPGVPVPAVEGHGAELLSMRVAVPSGGEARVLVATGRVHLYEGYTPSQVCRLVRICAMTGIRAAFLTNAGGCLRDWKLGELMAIEDHFNFSGASPFEGPVFTDIWSIWSARFNSLLDGIVDRMGTYALLRGPEFQTAAESRMLAANGVDNVGMSTILEAIALHQLGVEVAGLSVVSDLSFDPAPTEHEDVLRAMAVATPKVEAAITTCLSAI